LTSPWIFSLAVDAKDRLFAGSNAIFRSVNNGGSWSKVMSFPADVTFGPQVNSLTVTPAGHIFAGTFRAGVYRSINGGGTWAQVNVGLRDMWVEGVGSDNSGFVFAGTSGGAGLYRSKTSTIKWNKSNKGLVNSYVHALAVNASGHLFAGTSYTWYGGGMFRSTDRGAHWQTRGLADKEVNCIAINGSGHIFVGTMENGIFRSTNQGLTWMAVNAGLTKFDVRGLAINAGGHIFAGILYAGVYRSTDNGASWTLVNTGLTDKYIMDIIVAPNGHLFVSTNKGVFRSTDNGGSWTYKGLQDNAVFSLLAKAGGLIFAGTNYGGVFYSNDNGETWSNRGLKGAVLHSLAVNSTGHIFAAAWGEVKGEVGVYRSVNKGATWKNISSGLTCGSVSSLAVSPDGYLFAGTSGGGVFRSSAKL
jgi:ligand-binding sensor domain-containing protein